MLNGKTEKRADIICNLTNDGWFAANENAGHLQIAAFRCIENHTPMVRSVNTGKSAFIDSSGRILASLPARVEGTLIHQVNLDNRFTVFTRIGDAFGIACGFLSCIITAVFSLKRRLDKA